MTMGEIHLKWVGNEACNNARNCKITTTPPPTPLKNVDKKKHVGIHLKPYTQVLTQLMPNLKIVCSQLPCQRPLSLRISKSNSC
jgi:hypothetical protein